MPDEIDNQIKQRIGAIFPDAKTQAAVIDLVVAKKPDGWSRSSYAPYYKEFYALQIKPFIDESLKTREDIVYRYSVHCTGIDGVSKMTLYNKVNQALRYLLKFLDPDKVYFEWYNMVRIDKANPTALFIRYLPEFRLANGASALPELTVPTSDAPIWKRQMTEWLESNNNEPFIREKLCLSESEIRELKLDLDQLDQIAYSICAISIKIVRMR